MLFSAASVFACRISVKSENEKKFYKKGEIINVVVKVEKTHGNCKNSIENTDYKTKNMTILDKGKWTQDSDGTYSSKVKIKLTAKKGEKCAFAALRECSRGDRNSVVYFDIK
jgi:hypothetical protein